MSQLKNVVDPFGEVNVYPSGSRTRVVATILMEPHREGAQTGIALDGSGSMAKLYGVEDGSRVLSPIFGGAKKLHNEVTPVAQKLCAYLARKIDADGGTTCIYWAVGPGGGNIEVVQFLHLRLVDAGADADQHELHRVAPPRRDVARQPHAVVLDGVEVVQLAVGDEHVKAPRRVLETLDEVFDRR